MATLSSSYRKVLDLVGFHQVVDWGGVSVLLLLDGSTVLEEEVEEVGRAELVDVVEARFEVVEVLLVEVDFEVDLDVDLDVGFEVDLVDFDVDFEVEVADALLLGRQTDACDMEVEREDDRDDDSDE